MGTKEKNKEGKETESHLRAGPPHKKRGALIEIYLLNAETLSHLPLFGSQISGSGVIRYQKGD